jgi:hypothetical protein
MVICGRITLFGEYLMHSMADGYIVPTTQALATPDEREFPVHPEYRQERDSVRFLLANASLPTCSMVRGTLPLGHGFAGSTALTILHLGSCGQDYETIVNHVDRQVHGFAPSGVDCKAIRVGRAGCFGPVGWRSVWRAPCLAISALLVPEASGQDLAETRNKVIASADALIPIAQYLCSALTERNVLEYQALFDYALRLRRIGIYLPRATAVIDHALSGGIVAKCTGGLTNKAVIIVWPREMKSTTRIRILTELGRYGPDLILPRILPGTSIIDYNTELGFVAELSRSGRFVFADHS